MGAPIMSFGAAVHVRHGREKSVQQPAFPLSYTPSVRLTRLGL
jgi:hypothetical protein